MIRTCGLAVILFTATLNCFASCWKDGAPTQTVSLSVQGRDLDRWEAVMGEVHRVRLPAGFELGIQIDETTEEKYREILTRSNWRGVDEMVKITLLDLTSSSPATLSTTWGGVNSKQGFGPRGGANGVPELRDQIELWFHKPQCVTLQTLQK